MAAKEAEDVLLELRRLVDSLLKGNRAVSQEETDKLTVVIKKVLEDGFKGSRAVKGHLWNLINVSGRAYPVLLHPSIGKAKAIAKQEGLGDDAKVLLWIQEALHQGVLSTFTQKVPTQYHIMSAYSPEAAMCDTSLRSEFEGLLSQLKGLPPSLPDTEPCSSCGSVDASISEVLSPPSEHHIESSPAASPKQNVPETNIFRRLSQKGHGIQIPWLEFTGSRVDENFIHLSLRVIEDPEAGQLVKLSITPSQSAGLSQHGSFVSEVAQGFNNVLDTLVRRSSTADGKKVQKAQDSLEGALNEEDLKQVETHQDKQPSFQNMWGNIVKPFTKSVKSIPKAGGSKHTDSSDSAASPGKDDAHPSIPQKDVNEGNIDSITNPSAASPSAQKKDPPAWLKQSGLGFLAPVLGQKGAKSTDMTSGKDQATEVKPNKRMGTADSIEKHRPELFFQNLFRKNMQRSIHEEEEEEELQDLGGQELSSIGKKDSAPQASIEELEAELLLGDPLAASLTSGDAMRMSLQMLSPRSSTGLVKAAYVQEKMEMTSLKENEALISDIQTACETMRSEALLSGGVIRNDTKGTSDLCFSIEMLLSSSMRQKPRPWRPKGGVGLKFFTDIADLIPKGQKSPFMVLRNAQQMMYTNLDLPAGLEVDVIEGMMPGGGDSSQLHAWLRSSLNSQCLGQRIKAISDMDQLWEGWYEEGSLLYSKDGRKKFVSALKSIDDVHCLVAVDRWTEKKEEKGINRAPAGQASTVVPPMKSLQTSEAPSIAPSTARNPTSTSTERQGSKSMSRKQSSRQRKRVIDFDVEPQTTTPSPFETPELSTVPPNYFECAEPLSLSALAQALGMDSPEPFDQNIDDETVEVIQNEFNIDDIKLDSPFDKDEEVLEIRGPNNILEHPDEVNRTIIAQTTLDVSAESLETSLTSRIDLFLKDVGTQSHSELDSISQAEETTSMITKVTESVKSMDSDREETVTGGHHESASIPKIDFFRGADFVADHSLSDMEKDCTETMQVGNESMYEDSSLDELSSCAAEENVQEAIRIAEQEFEGEELIGNWSKRNYLPSCTSLGDEELEPLEPEDLGVSAEDLARSSHKYADTSLPQEITGAIDRSLGWESLMRKDDDQHDAQGLPHIAKGGSEVIQEAQVLDEMKPMDTLDGVWKDIDVLASEIWEDNSGSYTVYVVELTASDGTTWQVSRRFRDIVALRKKLKLREGILLPKSWENVKKSRHITGSSRLSVDIIDARNALMRQCLWDLRSTYTECLGWEEVATFLDAPLHILRGVKARTGTSTTDDDVGFSARLPKEAMGQGPGISMRLQVDLQKEESDEVLIEAQHGKCAGCHAALPDNASSWGLSSYLWTTSRSSGPRKCEYTNRLYCHGCHRNDLEVIPSHVLHNWDFTEKPVSKVSKEYLTSIKRKAVLGLGSVNPGLFARVPLLAHVQSMRQKVIRTLGLVKSAGAEGEAMAVKVIKESGVHGYLLEGTDFWSLHDLMDISKGSAFSSLPRWLETISGKIGRMATSAVLKYEEEG